MKCIKVFFILSVFLTVYSCEVDNGLAVGSSELSTDPTFTVTESSDNPALFSLENTTPNKDDFYSFWEIEGSKLNDDGVLEYEFKTSGTKTAKLTMVGSTKSRSTSKNLTVNLPIIEEPIVLPTGNLLLNGSLEEGDGDEFTNWGKFNGADRITASTDAIDGERAAAINNPADGMQFETQFVTDEVATVEGESYTASVWIKGDGQVVRFSTNPGVEGKDQYGPDYPATSEWTQYAFTFTANSETTLLALDMGATTGEFVIDAVALVAGDTPLELTVEPVTPIMVMTESILLNGSFEEGEGDEFTNWTLQNGADRFTGTDDALMGVRAAAINNAEAGNPWETQMVSDAAPTVEGENYTVSMWIKGDGQVVRFSTNPGVEGKDQYGPDYTATTEWTQYAYTFPANTETTLIALDMGTSAGEFVVDAVALIAGDTPLELAVTPEEPVVVESEGLILNGGFEEGEGNEFTNWALQNGAERFTATDDALTGVRAVAINNDAAAEPWRTQLVSDAFATEEGADYTVTVSIKGDGQIIRFSTNPGVEGKDQYGADYTATTDWSEYSFTFTANTETTLIALDMGTSLGEFVIDDVKAVKQ